MFVLKNPERLKITGLPAKIIKGHPENVFNTM